jgi:hypothetical protein
MTSCTFDLVRAGGKNKKPSKAQRTIRKGAEQTANEVEQTVEDAVMASSTNEPTAQKEAARKE